ncbi:MAG: hypothetical protein MPJ81_02550 [Gammaproteobacteria bacterium]|nr:hypothetical protein [Gammaproteobacteria bacterium]
MSAKLPFTTGIFMSKHTEHSSFREKLIEHLFVGELLKISWSRDCLLQVAKPEVDNAGYDLIAEDCGVIRHIQIKASYVGAKTSTQKVHLHLAKKASGCVIWIFFDENTLELKSFYFLGGGPGKPLPSIDHGKTAKHSKGDKTGHKAERPNFKVMNKGEFELFESPKALYEKLFGG